MSGTLDAMRATAEALVWPVVILIGLALLVVPVLWLLGLPGRRRERAQAAGWRARHPQVQLPPRRGDR